MAVCVMALNVRSSVLSCLFSADFVKLTDFWVLRYCQRLSVCEVILVALEVVG